MTRIDYQQMLLTSFLADAITPLLDALPIFLCLLFGLDSVLWQSLISKLASRKYVLTLHFIDVCISWIVTSVTTVALQM